LDTVSREEVLEHNLRLHQQTAERYDKIHYYLHNRFEQAHLWHDLSVVHRHLQRVVGGPVHYLDLGSGTGNLTLKLLSFGGYVVGVDISSAMMGVLGEKVAKAGHAGCFRGLVAPADVLTSIDDAAMHLLDIHAICVSSVLHHLYDYLAPLEQLRELCPALELVFMSD
jgi:ubiquinone/menaquinone biosynthesis C-methylase UbiE